MFTAAMQVVTGFVPPVTIFLPFSDSATVATVALLQNAAWFVFLSTLMFGNGIIF